MNAQPKLMNLLNVALDTMLYQDKLHVPYAQLVLNAQQQ